MRVLLATLVLMLSMHSLANQNQLFTPTSLGEGEPGLTELNALVFAPTEGRAVSVLPKYCGMSQDIRAKLPHNSDPAFSDLIKQIIELNRICNVDTTIKDGSPDIVAFTITNFGSPVINHKRGTKGESKREFKFSFNARSKQGITLELMDDVNVSSRMSHDYMHTSMVFIPRKVVPYVNKEKSQETGNIVVVLPTGEEVIFDAKTKEIIGGALSEKAMDTNPSRHARKFPQVDYEGNGLVIRANRRGGEPERTYKSAYNQNEKPTKATIQYKGKECLVPKTDIWHNSKSSDSDKVYFKFKSDQEAVDLINRKCNWNISLSDL